MGKIGQNPKIGQLWSPVAPQPYVVQKSWPDIGNSLVLGLQRGTSCAARSPPQYAPRPTLTFDLRGGGIINSISAVYPWPVAHSEWGTCLTLSKFGVLWANDPWMETFYEFLSKFCVSPTIHLLWPNLAKIDCCEVAEKSSGIANKKIHASGTLFNPPFCPHLADRAQNFVNIVGPGPGHVYRLCAGSAAVCRTYSWKSPRKVKTI